MKKIIGFVSILIFAFLSCNKNPNTNTVTKSITAGSILKGKFVYKEFAPPVLINVFKDTDQYPVLYSQTHLPDFLLIRSQTNKDNVITFSAGNTLKYGSRLPLSSDFSKVTVSGSSNVYFSPKPLKKGDSISNSLDWVPLFVLTTNDTSLYQEPFFDPATNRFMPSMPYIKNLWTQRSYLATRMINNTDTTFGWFELQANEDSVIVKIFRYGYQ